MSAAAAVLFDYSSGRVIYEKNAAEVRAPASLTKIMTALVALEASKLDTRMTVSLRAHSTSGALFGMGTGDKPPLWKLLYGMLLRSGNDAAVAVAEGVAGDEKAFAKLMNQKAVQLGLGDTAFVNPHGLTASGHVSTARDIAVLARVALQNEEFARIVATREKYMTWNGEPRVVTNIDKLLWRVDGVDGIKTGYTGAAGYCIAASATKADARGRGASPGAYKVGDRMVVVVLGATSSERRYQDAERLLAWGFEKGGKAESEVVSSVISAATYTVRAGDTLSQIAERLGVGLSVLASANRIQQPNSIRVGQKLVVPARR